MSDIPASIFRAYDIRGVVGKTLTPETAKSLGLALGSEAAARGETTLAVARDGRISGPEMLTALKEGITATGRDVIDLGEVPTPTLYFATHFLQGVRSGVMVTGSHNPPDYNGFKCVLAGETLSGEAIQNLYQRIQKADFKYGLGFIKKRDLSEDHLQAILSRVQLQRPLKVVLDTGNGVTGKLGPQLLHALGCELLPIFTEIDGTFPNHPPDPGKLENLTELINTVKTEQADLGLAFDGDGDRLGVVTPSGRLIYPDHLMMVFAEDLLQRHPGARILYDVKCTSKLHDIITQAGGQGEMAKSGHSLIKAQMQASGALLAGEMSGHIFFKDNWFGFDDGLYAAARLLEILSHQQDNADDFFNRYPQNASTPEINITVTDENKFALVAELIDKGEFPEGKKTTLDGLRIDYPDGWGLCRASNTTPVLVLRFEGQNQQALEKIAGHFHQALQKIDSSLTFTI